MCDHRHCNVKPGGKDSSKASSARRSVKLDSNANNQQTSQRCACSALNFETLDPRHPLESSQMLGKIGDLFFDQSCDVCQILNASGHLDRSPGDKEAHIAAVYTSVLLRCRSTEALDWWNIREHGAANDTTSYVILVPRRQIQKTWELRETRYSGFISPVQDGKGGFTWHARALGRKVDVDLIKSWLTFCNDNHASRCCDTGETDLMQSLRMIDCTVRHVVQWPRGIPYVALSYVCGTVNAQFHLESDKLPAQLPDTLGPTIDDAIILSRLLGIRYLWVDQYCIDQTDEANKANQIAQMDSIYRGAWLTVVAAAGKDANFGLPGVSSRVRASPSPVTINDKLVMAVPPKPEVIIRKSTWMQRGWTYQESILSHRLLVFGRSEVYFECDGSRFSEATDFPFDAADIRVSPTEWKRRTLFPSIAPTQFPGPFDDIFLHIHEFSKRRLTYSSDTLNAIQGIFNLFEKVYPQLIHLWGLPIVPCNTFDSFETNPSRPFTRTEQLLRSLSWEHYRAATRNPKFPSWSWAGWSLQNSQVNAPYGYLMNSFDIHVSLQNVEVGQPEIPVEAFCSMNRKLRDQAAHDQCLIFDASMIKATVVPSDKGNHAAFGRHYFVVFHGKPNVMMNNHVRMTARRVVSDGTNHVAHEENLLGIPLGEKLVEDDLADHSPERRAIDKLWRRHIVLLVKEVQKGWERVGLATFDQDDDDYFMPSTLQLSDGSIVHKTPYTPENFHQIPFFRRRIRLV